MLVSSLACSSTLKMKATCSSQTSVDFRRTIRTVELFITNAVRTSNPKKYQGYRYSATLRTFCTSSLLGGLSVGSWRHPFICFNDWLQSLQCNNKISLPPPLRGVSLAWTSRGDTFASNTFNDDAHIHYFFYNLLISLLIQIYICQTADFLTFHFTNNLTQALASLL
jgi:hypothetical protein